MTTLRVQATCATSAVVGYISCSAFAAKVAQ
jgi:hypothetical protein